VASPAKWTSPSGCAVPPQKRVYCPGPSAAYAPFVRGSRVHRSTQGVPVKWAPDSGTAWATSWAISCANGSDASAWDSGALQLAPVRPPAYTVMTLEDPAWTTELSHVSKSGSV